MVLTNKNKETIMYRKDTTIPSHGRRAKVDNAGTVRVKISRWPGYIYTGGSGFDFYLNIIPATMTYNATAESIVSFSGRRLVTSVDIPSEALERMVRLAQNKDFMSIKNADIFPDKAMLDGNDVRITVRSDIGALSLASNMLDDTLLDGWLPTAKMNFHTPFSQFAAPAFKAFGIDPYEDTEILVD